MIDARLTTLLDALTEALEGKPENDDDANIPRAAVVPALDATINFLRSMGVETRLRAPLFHLLAALSDANEGRSNPILTPAPYRDGTPKKKAYDLLQWVMASAAVDILKNECGQSTDKALDRMARTILADKDALREFRKNLGKPGRTSADAVRLYREWKATRKIYPALNGEQFVAIMIEKGAALTPSKKG